MSTSAHTHAHTRAHTRTHAWSSVLAVRQPQATRVPELLPSRLPQRRQGHSPSRAHPTSRPPGHTDTRSPTSAGAFTPHRPPPPPAKIPLEARLRNLQPTFSWNPSYWCLSTSWASPGFLLCLRHQGATPCSPTTSAAFIPASPAAGLPSEPRGVLSGLLPPPHKLQRMVSLWPEHGQCARSR